MIYLQKDQKQSAFSVVFRFVRSNLCEKIFYRDNINYFAILYDNKNYKWICRLRVEKAIKYLILPDENISSGKKYPIHGVNDLFNYSDLIIESASKFVGE